MRLLAACALAAALGLTASCMQSVVLTPPGAGGGGGGPYGAGGAPDFDGGFGHNGECPISVAPSAVVIALDRSTSMNTHFAEGSRLTVAQTALQTMMANAPAALYFGYAEFPAAPSSSGGSSCRPGAACCAASDSWVPPGASTEAIIEKKMSLCQGPLNGPGGVPSCTNGDGKPTADALSRIGANYQGWTVNFGQRYVLLVTDGESTCSLTRPPPDPTCDEASQQASFLSTTALVHTIVVDVNDDPTTNDCLDDVALSGGEPRAGSPSYLQPHDTASLKSLLGDKMRAVAQKVCHIGIEGQLADGWNSVKVTLHGNVIPQDPSGQNGWYMDSTGPFGASIGIYGDACNALMQETDFRQLVVQGCVAPPH
jgi:hypothetical protein